MILPVRWCEHNFFGSYSTAISVLSANMTAVTIGTKFPKCTYLYIYWCFQPLSKQHTVDYNPKKVQFREAASAQCTAHSLIRGVLIQSFPAGAKNFTNYVFSLRVILNSYFLKKKYEFEVWSKKYESKTAPSLMFFPALNSY